MSPRTARTTRRDTLLPLTTLFLSGDDGSFLWPGFGDNLRVLEWMIGRVKGEAGAVDTPIGALPRPEGLDLAGVELTDEERERSEEHTSELPSLMSISYADLCLKKKTQQKMYKVSLSRLKIKT